MAEQLVNPFGEEDDDFDVCSIIDSSLLISYLSVDKVHEEHDIILKDINFAEFPCSLHDMKNQSEHELNNHLIKNNLKFPKVCLSEQNYKSLLKDLENIENGEDDHDESTELLEVRSCKF